MKQKILIISLLMLFIIPFKVSALSGTVKITCNSTTITLNDTTVCHITATTDDEVSSLHSKINVSEGLELSSVTVDEIWEGDNDQVLDLYTADNKKETFAVASFVIKATKIGSQTITLTETTLGDKSFKEHNFTVSPYSITVIKEEENKPSSTSSSPTSSSSSSKPSSSSSSTPSSSSSSNSKPSSSSSSSNSSSSSSSSASSSEPSSSSSSSQQGTKKPLYTITLSEEQVYINKNLELSFTSNQEGTIKITSSNSKVLTTSSTSYKLSKNETKVFKLTGKKTGNATVTIEFIPTDTEYKIIQETRKITVKNIPNPNENVNVNPPTGNLKFFLIAISGLAILGYTYWYLRTNKQQ